jgi:DNA-binding CsgD family transcriptional regulator
VAVRATPAGRTEHCFLTVALDGGAAFTAPQREMFRRLQPEIDAALSRMAVPLVASEPILAQIVEETELGYLCLSPSGGVVELNARAHDLVRGYLQAARIEAGRGWLDRCAARMLAETANGRRWHLQRPDGRATMEARAHALPKGAHAVVEPVTLVVLREMVVADEEPHLGALRLTPMQRKVAHQLVTTGRSYKEIAAALGIADGTLNKHIEHVYRAVRVQSRPELIARLR